MTNLVNWVETADQCKDPYLRYKSARDFKRPFQRQKYNNKRQKLSCAYKFTAIAFLLKSTDCPARRHL